GAAAGGPPERHRRGVGRSPTLRSRTAYAEFPLEQAARGPGNPRRLYFWLWIPMDDNASSGRGRARGRGSGAAAGGPRERHRRGVGRSPTLRSRTAYAEFPLEQAARGPGNPRRLYFWG